ncbi:unnamed protein product [Gadus morhua 'NCC']
MMSCGCLGCRGDHCCGFPPLQSLLKSKAQQEPKSGSEDHPMQVGEESDSILDCMPQQRSEVERWAAK